MSRAKKYSLQHFNLPELRNQLTRNTNSTLLTSNKNVLKRYELQLRSKDASDYTSNKLKRNQSRLKTIDVNDHETYDDLRRELRSVKQAISYKINQYNHRLQNKLDQYALLSNIKRDPQVIYQPVPMFIPPPPIYPPMYQPRRSSLMSQSREQFYNNNHPRPAKRPKKKRIPSKKILRNFRKAGFAVLFTIRLRKFANKVISFRKQMFKRYLYDSNEFRQQANQIKKMMIDCMKPFLLMLLQKQDSELKLNQGDSQKFKKQKTLTTRKAIELLTQCLRKMVDSESFDSIIRSVYYFCRHGSYACLQKLLTNEQLQNISVSEKNHYLQAEKNLEKSQIINFLFMKLLIYNALGQSWKIDPQKFSKQKQTLQQNILLITSIFYELLMDIQDDFIVNSPQCYPLNNYLQIRDAKIYPSESLTIKAGDFRKNEMISGLINQNYIKSTYKIDKLWVKQRNELTQIVEDIHAKVVDYHRKLIKPFL